MFVDVIKLPPVHGLPPIQRTALLSSLMETHHYRYQDPHTPVPMLDYDPNSVLLGSDIQLQDTPFLKTIHVSRDGMWVFESMIAAYQNLSWYLYVKMLGPRRDVAIGFHTIESYRASPLEIHPLSHILWSEVYNRSAMQRPVTIDQVVPPLFIERGMVNDTAPLWDLIWQHVPLNCTADRYEPILRHEPGLFDALVHGAPNIAPHNGIMEHYPYIQVPRSPMSKWTMLQMSAHIGMEVIVNHELFDHPALDVTVQRMSQFSVSLLLKDVVEGAYNCATIHSIDDPYYRFVQPERGITQWVAQDLGKIFHDALHRYCLVHGIRMENYAEDITSKSYITIEKTLGDEISFTINDMVYDRFVCFYCHFPLIALGTKSVGSVVR